MKYHLPNKGEVILTQADFKAAGGQGSVYVKGGTAYKIYADPKQVIPPAKLQELSALTLPNIIRPQELLLDERNQAVGYTMRQVEQAYSLCQLFPKAFRQRTNLTPEVVWSLVQKLQTGVRHVHAKGILVVDLNEMNFLVAEDFGALYFIDVDSYQTPSFPAAALMETVRDRHAKQLDENSDWFSFAVVSFQMFVGIHPYRGVYPPLQKLKDKAQLLAARMQANISVLHPAVSVPAACLPFNVIPAGWLDWYKAIFEEGKRLPPPEGLQTVITTTTLQPKQQAGSNQFDLTELYEFDSEILFHFQNFTITKHSVYTAGNRLSVLFGNPPNIALTPRHQQVLAAWLDGAQVCFRNLTTGFDLPTELRAEKLMSHEGRLYLKAGDRLSEVELLELTNKLLIQAKPVGNVLPNATQLFDGVAMQNLLGACYASFVPASGSCYQTRLPELAGYQIVAAKVIRHVLLVLGAKKGVFDRFVFRFTGQFDAYDVRVSHDLTLTDLNFTVLDTGVCLHLTDHDELELFASRPGTAGLKVLRDPALSSDDKLFAMGAHALLARGNRLFRFAMK